MFKSLKRDQKRNKTDPGIYIMQNTMVRGAGWSAVEKIQNWEKHEKGERKKEENYIKNGKKRP